MVRARGSLLKESATTVAQGTDRPKDLKCAVQHSYNNMNRIG